MRPWIGPLVTVVLCLWLPPSQWWTQHTRLDAVQALGELVVLTRNSPTTYYIGAHGPAGFSLDLISRFADSLGVTPRFTLVDDFESILPKLRAGSADLAAAGIAVTPQRQRTVRFGPPVLQIKQQVVYKSGNTRPRKPMDLVGHQLEVMAGTSFVERLKELKKDLAPLQWTETQDLEVEDLLAMVSEGSLEYTVADSNQLAVHQGFYLELRAGFDLTGDQDIAWAFADDGDETLLLAARKFLSELKNSGELERIQNRHFGHAERFDYVDARAFGRAVENRLTELRPTFEEAAEESGLDWRLLAAIGYQESHWNADATSPTGVRGIMMLTRATAKRVGIDNRLDERQSIIGGARYFAKVKKKLPARIPEPDRTWMALASYNVGFGHLEDTRKITQANGGDPDRWLDVKRHLPLLSQPKWYKKTRHGYARGREPMRYVENVRRYRDLLAWHLGQRKRIKTTHEPWFDIKVPAI
ncbi:MAG: membrane-bound lytic murein transglycosylase MltF [Chromatiales bacterium]|nr:membrane-bound lytic murein transglycosylase MltF [Chromatiales bacterium]